MSDDPALQGDPTEDFEDLYENAPCGYVSIRVNDRVFKANATLGRWLGFAAEKLVGKRFQELLGVAGRMYYETHFAPLVALRGHFDEVALDLVASSGERIPMLVNAVAVVGEDGSHRFTRLTLFNATERRRYERDRRDASKSTEAARRELQSLHAEVAANLSDERETSALREQFIGVLGHDLRNPLAAISGGLRLMRREGITEERRDVIGKMVEKSAGRMAGLIDDVMDFARGRLGGGLTLDRNADQPLGPVLRHVVEELQSVAPERGIDVKITLDEPVNCDRRRIGQMMSNLLANAMTHGDASSPVKVEATTGAGVLRISVANSGAPIPEAMLERIFEPFERNRHRSSQQGLGLGLYISHQIAKAHGGNLDVASDEQETRFTFDMPLRNETRCLSHIPVWDGWQCLCLPANFALGRGIIDGVGFAQRRSRSGMEQGLEPLLAAHAVRLGGELTSG